MRNNPYNKKLKDQIPLVMLGPGSTTALISDERQKDVVEKAMKPSTPVVYKIDNVSFLMIRPPFLNKSGILNPEIEIGQTEVTQELFLAVMGRNASYNQSSHQNPVERVTWYDCIEFCNRLSTLLGFEECYRMADVERDEDSVSIIEAKIKWDESKNGFRLPTGEDWEFFAKAGTNNQWSGTNNEDALDQYAWYYKNAGNTTHPVGEKLPNEWGLYDMSGNVWEWCWDLYYPNNTKKHVMHGGSYGNDGYYCRVTYGGSSTAENMGDDLGLRLCRSIG